MVRITVKNLQKKVLVYPHKIKEKIIKVLKGEKFKGEAEITVCFINDRLIRKLNKKFLKKDCPTDVLAFNIANHKKAGLSADIIISAETALRNTKIFKTTPAYELSLYSVHGVLHLLGYNDHSVKEKEEMRKKEKEYVHT